MTLAALLLADVAAALEADPTLAAKLRALLGVQVAEADPYVRLAECGISAGTVRRAARAKELRVFRVGRDHFLSRAEVAQYIARRQVVRAAPVGDEVDQALARVGLR